MRGHNEHDWNLSPGLPPSRPSLFISEVHRQPDGRRVRVVMWMVKVVIVMSMAVLGMTVGCGGHGGWRGDGGTQ